MRIYILILLALSTVFAATANDDSRKIESLMKNYLQAIKSKDQKKLKSLVTDKYYSQLEKDQGLEKLFSMQKDDKSPIDVDIKVVKQKQDHRANIKNKSESDYDHYWFRIVSEKESYKIDGTFHLEEAHSPASRGAEGKDH